MAFEVTMEDGGLVAQGMGDIGSLVETVRGFVAAGLSAGPTWLDASEVEQAFSEGRRLAWHPSYGREAWCDGGQPLDIASVWRPGSLFPNTFVGYRCRNPGCRWCRNPHMPWSSHFRIIRPDGLDRIGAGVEVEIRRGRRRESEMVLVDQPVFAPWKECG